jgi:hypothetical protein
MLLTHLHSMKKISDEDYRRTMRYLETEGDARSEFD